MTNANLASLSKDWPHRFRLKFTSKHSRSELLLEGVDNFCQHREELILAYDDSTGEEFVVGRLEYYDLDLRNGVEEGHSVEEMFDTDWLTSELLEALEPGMLSDFMLSGKPSSDAPISEARGALVVTWIEIKQRYRGLGLGSAALRDFLIVHRAGRDFAAAWPERALVPSFDPAHYSDGRRVLSVTETLCVQKVAAVFADAGFTALGDSEFVVYDYDGFLEEAASMREEEEMDQ